MSKEQLAAYWEESGVVTDKRVLSAFMRVQRELFVLPADRDVAYEDRALPIRAGQTISQPSTVVAMLQALRVRLGMKVLEVGAGSGYQAALLGMLVGKRGRVIAIERMAELVVVARKNLERAKLLNVQVVEGEGSQGFRGEAPFDRIIVSAAAPRIPEPLVDQLKTGGILVIPVGTLEEQELVRLTKLKSGVHTEQLGGYVFVPLRGKYGFAED